MQGIGGMGAPVAEDGLVEALWEKSVSINFLQEKSFFFVYLQWKPASEKRLESDFIYHTTRLL